MSLDAAWIALVRWTAWNTLFLLSLMHAHNTCPISRGAPKDACAPSGLHTTSREQAQMIGFANTAETSHERCSMQWLTGTASSFCDTAVQSRMCYTGVCAHPEVPVADDADALPEVTSVKSSVSGLLGKTYGSSDMVVMDLPFFQAHWWKLIIW